MENAGIVGGSHHETPAVEMKGHFSIRFEAFCKSVKKRWTECELSSQERHHERTITESLTASENNTRASAWGWVNSRQNCALEFAT